MLNVDLSPSFLKTFAKIKDNLLKKRIKKQLGKIGENPEVGKPMRNSRKGTREIRISSFRLSYAYYSSERLVVILDFYHKDEQ
jgi:mRNA-degrading endonuclease RelE of RelBE toxin-antitoxin system